MGDNIKEAGKLSVSILIAVILAWFLVYNLGTKTTVIGSGMEPSMYNGQALFISKLSYLFGKPKAGDVVVFLPNGNENTYIYVKRVVATPGDVVEIKKGKLYINNEEYSGEIDYDKIEDPGIAEEAIICGIDEYFVLGDNVNFSEDSRSGNVGLIKRSLIKGRVWLKLKKGDSGTEIIL